jgi:hypothetical protein
VGHAVELKLVGKIKVAYIIGNFDLNLFFFTYGRAVTKTREKKSE